MDQTRARALLAAERVQLKRLLQAETGEPQAADVGDEVDDADRRNAERPAQPSTSSCKHGGRRSSGPRRGLPPAATAGRCTAAGRSPTSGWRPTHWPS
jgi:hypothetical protein